jgi:hypothetical protein
MSEKFKQEQIDAAHEEAKKLDREAEGLIASEFSASGYKKKPSYQETIKEVIHNIETVKYQEANDLDKEAEKRVKKGEAATLQEAVDDIVHNRDKRFLDLINDSADRILQRINFPLVTSKEKFTINNLDDTAVLKEKFQIAKETGDFSSFPGEIKIASVDASEEIISFLEALNAPVVDVTGKERRIFIKIFITNSLSGRNEKLDAVIKKLKLNIPGSIYLGHAMTGSINSQKLLLGDRQELKQFLKACQDETCRGVVCRKNSCLKMFNWRYNEKRPWDTEEKPDRFVEKLDGILFAARSGVHFGFVLKGFFDALKEKYPDIQEPSMVGMWHHLADFKRKFSIQLRLEKIFEKYPTLEKLKQAKDSSFYESWESKQMKEESFKILKENWGVFIYETLELTKKQLRSVCSAKGKKGITVAVFDESDNHGNTADSMLDILQSAANQLKEEGITVKLTAMPNILGAEPGGSYETWDQEERGERLNDDTSPYPKYETPNQAKKSIRPLKNEGFRHILHRLQIAVARESGYIEAKNILESDKNDEETLRAKKELQEIVNIYGGAKG